LGPVTNGTLIYQVNQNNQDKAFVHLTLGIIHQADKNRQGRTISVGLNWDQNWQLVLVHPDHNEQPILPEMVHLDNF